jgi:flavin-dependent dehydrogenase
MASRRGAIVTTSPWPVTPVIAAAAAATSDSRAWDAIVVGAGPAGAIAAFELARAGARVLLVDKATFPRRKVCGGCLNQRALAALRDAGLERHIASLGPKPQRQLRLAAGRAEARLDLPGTVSLSRERLDAALVAAAVDAGAVFLPGRRARIREGDRCVGDTRGIDLVGAGGDNPVQVRGRVVVAADGLGGALATEALGGERLRRRSRIGAGAVLEESVRVDWDDATINMAVGRAGYVGSVRVEDGRWNVAAAIDPEAVRRHSGIAPVVCGILREVGWSVPGDLLDAAWRGTPPLWRQPRKVAAERLFVVGDAAGYVEPFTGEGMAWALTAGRAVAPFVLRAIRRWDPGLVAQWTHDLHHDVQRGQTVSRLMARALGNRTLAVLITSLLAAWPWLGAPAISRLNAVDPGPREGGIL